MAGSRRESATPSVEEKLFPVIDFEGIDAGGKTLLARRAADHFGGVLLGSPPPELAALRAHFDTQEPLRTRFHFYALGAAIVSRQANELRLHNPVFLDRYYYTTIISHRAAGLDGDLEAVIRSMGLVEPDLVFCIDCVDEAERQRRLHHRGWTVNDTRFREFVPEMRRLYQSFPQVVHVDTSGMTDDQGFITIRRLIEDRLGLGR